LHSCHRLMKMTLTKRFNSSLQSYEANKFWIVSNIPPLSSTRRS
jgi:hypothetical protein